MSKSRITKHAKTPVPVKPLKCTCACAHFKGKSITVFEDVTVGPGANFDSGVAHNVDGYRYLERQRGRFVSLSDSVRLARTPFMARKLRVHYPGAIYNVINHGRQTASMKAKRQNCSPDVE